VSSEGASGPVLEPAPERASRIRQRQRLIDACISALHIYGPSRTTVERVVALADMSPGIVRFYFESKAAMLVASLEFLAAEFEQRVLLPVARLKHAPVRALELLVELYLDADIASPRKVSVWYAFWGEASSRQEYLQICGKKDEDFEALVRELMQRMIEDSGERHLDADGVALGLMGVLEVLWQSIAFQTEANIDRRAAKRRTLNYLRSIFPRQFALSLTLTEAARLSKGAGFTAADAPARLPAWAYADTGLFAAEREQLFGSAWQIAGHVSELARAGDYLAIDLPTERALLLRDGSDRIRGFHNTCRRRPHTLLNARSGTLDGTIDCAVHGLRYGYDGTLRRGDTPGDLLVLEVAQSAGLLLVRPAGREPETGTLPAVWSSLDALRDWRRLGEHDLVLAADWKLVVEQWLESAVAPRPLGWLAELAPQPEVSLDRGVGTVEWRAQLNQRAAGWSAGHYARLACASGGAAWRRLFVQPNQLIEIRPDGALVLQVIPESPGRCRVRRLELGSPRPTRRERALRYLAQRLARQWLRQDFDVVVSIQTGLEGSDSEATDAGPVPEALAAFRSVVFALLAGQSAS
jgi:TetR/AcrR family transcriptional regulator, transcriptional repressor of bet genes